MPLISFIPERYEEGLKRMVSIDDKVFASILEGLSYTSLVSSLSILTDRVTKINNNLDTTDLREIFLSAGSLTVFLDKGTIQQIVDDITALMEKKGFINSEKIDTLKQRLSLLLENQQIYFAAKANRLMTEYGSVYINSRVITDIRPIFGPKVEDVPKAGVIVHNLHIHYQAEAEGNHKDIFLALDSKDIKTLKEALIRAEKKESALQALYDKMGLTNLNE
jgi:hypothetical protein